MTDTKEREAFDAWFAEEFEHLNPIGIEASSLWLVWKAAYSSALASAAEREKELERRLREMTKRAEIAESIARDTDASERQASAAERERELRECIEAMMRDGSDAYKQRIQAEARRLLEGK